MKRILFSLLAFSFTIPSIAQTVKTFTGGYKLEGYEGTATYTYIQDGDKQIMQGKFSFTGGLKTVVYKCQGSYLKGEKDGLWTKTKTWSKYYGMEKTKNDLYFSRVSPSTPFIEVSIVHSTTWSNGSLNGEENLVLNRKDSWGTDGGGSKLTVFKKQKHWKQGRIVDFKFDIIENNIPNSSIKGQYYFLDDKSVYDGSWTGFNEDEQFTYTYKKGMLLKKTIKDRKTSQVTQEESYIIDDEIIAEMENNKNISVALRDESGGYLSSGNLKIERSASGKPSFTFYSISKELVYPCESHSNSFNGYINSCEVQNPYDKDVEDNEWTAYNATVTKKYLSTSRGTADRRPEFQSVDPFNYSDYPRFFEALNEERDSIEFIGTGEDFCKTYSGWRGGKASYLGPNLYLYYLLYKGNSKAVQALLNDAEKKGYFDRKKDENRYGRYLGTNVISTEPIYYIAICLNQDSARAFSAMRAGLNSFYHDEDGLASWEARVKQGIDTFLVNFPKGQYTESQLSLLKNTGKYLDQIRQEAKFNYFDVLVPMEVGSITWTKHLIKPHYFGINVEAVLDRGNGYNSCCDSSLLILENLKPGDNKKLESEKWRLPTLKELKDLFAHNLDDLAADGFEIDGVYPMYEGVYSAVNTRKQVRLIGKDESGKLFVYNADANTVAYPNTSGKDKISGLIKMVRK